MWAFSSRFGRHAVLHLTVPTFFGRGGEGRCTSRARCWEQDAHRRATGRTVGGGRCANREHVAHGRWRSCIGGLGRDVTWSRWIGFPQRREPGVSAERVWSGGVVLPGVVRPLADAVNTRIGLSIVYQQGVMSNGVGLNIGLRCIVSAAGGGWAGAFDWAMVQSDPY